MNWNKMAIFGKPVSSFRGYLSHFWRVMANETIAWQSALLPFKFEQFCSNVGQWPGDGRRCGKDFVHRTLPPQFIFMNFFKNHEYVCVQNLQEVTWEWLQVMGEDDVSGAKLSKFFKVVFWSLSGQKWISEWVKPLKNAF